MQSQVRFATATNKTIVAQISMSNTLFTSTPSPSSTKGEFHYTGSVAVTTGHEQHVPKSGDALTGTPSSLRPMAKMAGVARASQDYQDGLPERFDLFQYDSPP